MNYKPDGPATCFGCFTAVVALFVKPWVLTMLWGWYLVPLGAPELGMLSAFGVVLCASLLTHQASIAREKATDENAWYGQALTPILWPLLILAIGALARGIFA